MAAAEFHRFGGALRRQQVMFRQMCDLAVELGPRPFQGEGQFGVQTIGQKLGSG